jgi:4-hydroxy-3-methylbut-2-enyl diphosphate reductase
LAKVAKASGCARVLRITDAGELPTDLKGTIGVTAGASAPESLVVAVIERLAPKNGVESVTVTNEDEYFPPPPELRDLVRALGSVLSLMTRRPLLSAETSEVVVKNPLQADRNISAADVLEALAS